MKRHHLIVGLAILWLTTPLCSMSKTEQSLQTLQSDFKLLEIWIEAQQAYRGVPGIVVGLVHDQELVYTRGFGYADLEQKTTVDEYTPFRIASITKTFTATAIMQLRDAGKLRLDDPVVDYLPWFNIKQRFAGEPPITIRQLLTHTSGLPREADYPYWTDHYFPTLEEIKARLAQQETIYPPADQIKYSNLGMALAGEIVAAVSGVSYDEYIHEHLFKPLGMTSSSVNQDASIQSQLVTPYSHRQSDYSYHPEAYVDTRGIAPAANIVSNMRDLASYVSLQFRESDQGEDAVLKGSSLREMHRVQFLNPSWSSGWGLGWSVWQRDGKTVNGHAGWVGGNRTQIIFIPEDKVGVIVLTNSDDGEPSFFARNILDFMGPALTQSLQAAGPDPATPKAWEQYVGRYVEPGPYYTDILIHHGKLIMSTLSFPPESQPDSEIVELEPAGKHQFRMMGDNGNGELLIFELDPQGQIMRIKVGSNYIYPPERYPFQR